MGSRKIADCTAAVLAALRVLFVPAQVVELRVLGLKYGRTASGYFDDLQALAEFANSYNGAGGVYVTVNPVNPALLARANNRARELQKSDSTSSDADIVRRRYFLVDTDPKRPSGISSSEEEHTLALARAQQVRQWLAERGWADPIEADSGNGGHLLYRVDLPNDGATKILFERCLEVLANKFSDDRVKIDTVVFNAARIWRLYGTLNVKGDHTDERPHRQAKILNGPEQPGVVTVEQLESLASLLPTKPITKGPERSSVPKLTQTIKRPETNAAMEGGPFDIGGWIARAVDEGRLSVSSEKPWKEGGRLWIINPCPFDSTHTNGAAYISQLPNGALAAGCKHDGCKGKNWHSLRDLVEPGWRDRRSSSRARSEDQPEADELQRDAVVTGDSHPGAGIVIGVDEERVNDEAVVALASHKHAFQRGGTLVHVIREETKKGIKRVKGAPRIALLPQALLREMLASAIAWMKREGKKLIRTHPPAWSIGAVHARGNWPGIRVLEGIVESPVIRPDGTVLELPGYDEATGLLYIPNATFQPIPANPDRNQVKKALELLLEATADFPFERPVHKAAWLAAVLTLFARHAFDGPAPLFLIDANLRGVGKSLLADATGMIATGRPMARMAHVDDNDDEMRKRITAIAIAGDPTVLIDNVSGVLGSPAFDAALTGVVWKDRILGESKQVELPLNTTWFATANNVELGADTVRRTLHVRLQSPEEKPETRTGFRHPRLLEWVTGNRGPLVASALTILRAYVVAGRPSQRLPQWGSFDGWSDLIRNSVVWAGLEDPGAAREGLEGKDKDRMLLELLIEGLVAMPDGSTGVTASAIIAESQKVRGAGFENESLAEALGMICDDGGKAHPNSVARHLGHLRKRVVDGRMVDSKGSKKGTLWFVTEKLERTGTRSAQAPVAAAAESLVVVRGGEATPSTGTKDDEEGVEPSWD